VFAECSAHTIKSIITEIGGTRVAKRRRKPRNARKRRPNSARATWIFVLVLLVLGGGMLMKDHIQAAVQPQPTAHQVTVKSVSGETPAQQAFIQKVATPAVKVYRKNGQVLPSIVIAQSILESSWGTSKIFQQANNPFGIKGSYHGKTGSFVTHEYVNGERIKIHANFRIYPSLTVAIQDHDNVLKSRYLPQPAKNYQEASQKLQAGGYATDPNYAQKLNSLIVSYKLNQFDK